MPAMPWAITSFICSTVLPLVTATIVISLRLSPVAARSADTTCLILSIFRPILSSINYNHLVELYLFFKLLQGILQQFFNCLKQVLGRGIFRSEERRVGKECRSR